MPPEIVYMTRALKAGLVAEKWEEQYRSYMKDPAKAASLPHNPFDTYRELLALGPTPNPDAVDEIIGNNSWTHLTCEVCSTQVDEWTHFNGSDEDALSICTRCIITAFDLLAKKGTQ
jgi:hypothetical protein